MIRASIAAMRRPPQRTVQATEPGVQDPGEATGGWRLRRCVETRVHDAAAAIHVSRNSVAWHSGTRSSRSRDSA